jgi:type II secretory pathway component PulC
LSGFYSNDLRTAGRGKTNGKQASNQVSIDPQSIEIIRKAQTENNASMAQSLKLKAVSEGAGYRQNATLQRNKFVTSWRRFQISESEAK